jgi:hypothetical protein
MFMLLHFLRDKASDRKFRLFSCACCRRIWHLLTEVESRELVELSERYADGMATYDDLLIAVEAQAVLPSRWRFPHLAVASAAAFGAASYVGSAESYERAARYAASAVSLDDVGEKKAQCIMLCDIFGPLPFKEAAFDPSWLTSNVTALAQAIYDERTFDRLPILGDALEDAGCDNADILNHCRQPGVHVRGCWLVDLILGKK